MRISEIDRNTLMAKAIPQGLSLLANLEHIAKATHVDAVRNMLPGMTAYVCGAGPSLALAADELRARREDSLIIAVNTALGALHAHGVRPHLVSVMESIDLTTKLADAEMMADRMLLDVSCAPAIMERSQAPLVYHGPSTESRLYSHALGYEPIMHSGAALTGAIGAAMRLGCSPIVLCGVDLGFREGRVYADGAMWELDVHRDGDRLVFEGSPEREEVHAEAMQPGVPRRRPVVEVPAVDGGTTYTTGDYQSQIEWVDATARTWPIARIAGPASVALPHVPAWTAGPPGMPSIIARALIAALDEPLGAEAAGRLRTMATTSLEHALENAEAVLAGQPVPHLTTTHSAYEGLIVPGILEIVDTITDPCARRRAVWQHIRDAASASRKVV